MNHRPTLIELVGPAGVGKSTIRQLLVARHGVAARGVWRVPYAHLLRSAAHTLPACLDLWRRARTVPWEETKHLIKLDALYRIVHAPGSPRSWVLDEGPVFALAWLRVFGHAAAQPKPFAPWWGDTVARWRQSLDAIVWLDAPNAVLAERIRARPKPHLLKTASDADIAAFLDAYRAAFAATVADLAAGNGGRPDVIRLETTATPPEAIIADLAARLNGKIHAH